MQLHRGSRYWMALALVAVPAAARGQGFGLNELSACGIGRAFAATATGCHDASAIYWNPAALTTLSGWSLALGATAIPVNGQFEQDTTFRTYESDVPTSVVPHFYLSHHAPASQLALGIGAYVPYGLTSRWTDSFPGRFEARKASLQTIYTQPNVAWQITPRWSVGGGPIIGHSSVELIQSVDLSEQTVPGTAFTFANLGIPRRSEFARARLKGSAWGYGAHLGVEGKLSPSWTMGLRVLTPITFRYSDADATFQQVSTGLIVGGTVTPPFVAGTQIDALVQAQFQPDSALGAQKVSTKITHPGQIQLGFAYTGLPGWELEADYAWIGYSAFKDLPIDFSNSRTPDRTLIEDYNNSSSIRLGVERRFANDLRLRAGFAGVAAAAPDETVTPLLPDQDRANYTLGASLPLLGRFVLDAAYLHVATPGRRGRIDERTSRDQTADQLNTGVYSLSANIFSLSLKASF
ncbi:MAG TPA: outer membrane protein transport protein [Gemmatimonadaceae bacterium]|nr:outer membrane protein transport protein [Gemmatimonadaceae bacterium]